MRNFDITRSDRATGNGSGTAILIRNGIKYCRAPLRDRCNDKLEACYIKIFVGNRPLTISSCYRPPHISISFEEWVTFIEQFVNEDYLIGDDFNSHHVSWSGSRNSTEGVRLFDVIFESDSIVLNNGKAFYAIILCDLFKL